MSRYTTELIWPPFKGKAHKVVDTATGKGVGLYRTAEGARRKAKTMNEAPPVATPTCPNGGADHYPADDCATCATFDYRPACPRCAQINYTDGRVCGACVKAERVPQGEAVRLFTPAPTQLEGQMNF